MMAPGRAWFNFAVAAIVLGVLSADAVAERGDPPGRFSYYALVLSWSPTFCADLPPTRNDRQCRAARPYAFVLHGLWPQYERGWPEYCRVKDRWVPDRVLDSMLDIMPNRRLVIHEWRKHGVCSGLAPDAYFGIARKLYETIKIPERYVRPDRPIQTIPEEVEREFLLANPVLNESTLSVSCGRRKRLRDIRICFDRSFKPRACGDDHRQAKLCRLRQIVLPPARSAAPNRPGGRLKGSGKGGRAL